MRKQPIDQVVWQHVHALSGNGWNPNLVHTQELKLLKHSLLTDGWTQPLLVQPCGQLVDGFHRWMLASEDAAVFAATEGKVPTVVLALEPWQAMVLTVRMNRAKGTHVALRMADLVKALVDDHGLSLKQVAQEIGAHLEEVRVLYAEDVFSHRSVKDTPYSRAWVPRDSIPARDLPRK